MGLHLPELIIVLVAALLIFGPKKLPEMGSAIGKSVKAFRKSVSEMANPQDNEDSNPSDTDVPDPAAQDALPGAQRDARSQRGTSFTSDEIRTEKHAD
ncbi:MAG TPA: twin-arginine translocase TatA/TatE family subunit [Ktedonobacteraceae bacterium]|nr:twin-arginine translocase TatA/TatE family subunit [Ktedonobacteraceae bacterium]